ncbi:MAG: DNA repair protein RadC [Candidatus Melainabacteria bacterium]|nr:DNA repair protein RadC [Candidatus Melainabacteria bacterium]
MPTSTKAFAKKLQYTVPQIQLYLVYENLLPHKLCQLNSPEDAENLLEPLRYATEEHFVTLHLNVQNEVLGIHEVSHGSLSSSLVHPREVFKAAILSNSYAIVVCHNHPSLSQVLPSLEDLRTTRQLIESGKLLGISVLDHLIISPNQDVYSLRENHPELWSN